MMSTDNDFDLDSGVSATNVLLHVDNNGPQLSVDGMGPRDNVSVSVTIDIDGDLPTIDEIDRLVMLRRDIAQLIEHQYDCDSE